MIKSKITRLIRGTKNLKNVLLKLIEKPKVNDES